MKCREYNMYNVLCQSCDIESNIQCSKKFDFNTPKKYVGVERRDIAHFDWNECPTCGDSIGYHPKDKDFKCPKCNQKILWK